jgi:hypothetical protein
MFLFRIIENMAYFTPELPENKYYILERRRKKSSEDLDVAFLEKCNSTIHS